MIPETAVESDATFPEIRGKSGLSQMSRPDQCWRYRSTVPHSKQSAVYVNAFSGAERYNEKSRVVDGDSVLC